MSADPRLPDGARGAAGRRRAGLATVLLSLSLSLSLSLTLVACGRATSSRRVESPAAAADQATESARHLLEHTTTAGVRAEDSHAPVEMRMALASAPVVGQPFTFALTVLPTEGAPSLKVEAVPVDGLTPGPVGAPLSYEKVERGVALTVPFTYTPARNGVFLVKFTATESSPSGSDGATYTFPVVVGPQILAPPPSAAKGADGAPAPVVARPPTTQPVPSKPAG